MLARAGSTRELDAVAAVVAACRPPVLVLGRGSNLLVADRGFPGLVLVLDGDFEQIDVRDDAVRAGGAVLLPVLARRAAAAGRTGLEFYVGIPGSVGGGAHERGWPRAGDP
ncbi:MAG: FAD-binding protein [Acidimicrobiia bacterium]|nr:FAD-binding protein [Acidimicrobiia bacterium]